MFKYYLFRTTFMRQLSHKVFFEDKSDYTVLVNVGRQMRLHADFLCQCFEVLNL